MILHQLEIIVSRDKDSYIAKSAEFPSCSGKGETETQAFEKLSASIGRLVSKQVKTSLSQVFNGNKYTEILFDTASRQKEQTRVYSLVPTPAPPHKQAWVKLDTKVLSRPEPPVESAKQGGLIFGFPISDN